MAEQLAIMGEIHTGLLHNSVAVAAVDAARLLDHGLGEHIRRSERPAGYVVSPDELTGVDCALPVSSGARVRGIGTAASRSVIVGGHVVQGSAHLRVLRAEAGRRLPWSHYLAQPGVVECLHPRASAGELTEGLLRAPRPGELDLAAISGRALDRVQERVELDHRAPFRTVRTRLRWTVDPPGPGRRPVGFAVLDRTTRTLRLPHSDAPLADQAALCEDLALHDWLLTTLLNLVERSGIGAGPRRAVLRRLLPALDFLAHLWMPGARVAPALTSVWQSLERRPGLSRQWQVNVDRVRDLVALTAIESSTALP